ncbi:AAA family ATPase [Chengkuizengella axinellae]|uniref:AAA family ATPase n=1 Tax=Chengkuizengella axinellae TaxID=3064388 RepID=A0ABT9IVL8_9BACL|nr:AAA family ATPase [Chengkuizengella sp. 2205SS18-9]MDP5273122.1 AAA family ATPase [Chengkuizengella sp. 2205SS18-9]
MIKTKTDVQECINTIQNIKKEISRVIVGQEDVIDQMLWSIFAEGHVLLEGIPGLGKTKLVSTIADTVDLVFSRVQFTPDLMPADITGTNVIQFGTKGETHYQFQKGPIFGNLILADEINRATPKTQSALLEAMQEKTVTSGSKTYQLPEPFFVLATQNPIENEGTYPLPEAQLDRFLLKILISYPSKDELKEIVNRTTTSEVFTAQKISDATQVQAIQKIVKDILVSEDILEHAAVLLMKTHPEEPSAPSSVKSYVRYGSGPRGIQAMISVAKVRALCAGRLHVSMNDIHTVAYPVLRHRMSLNFEGQAAGKSTDFIIQEIIQSMEEA